MIKPILFLDFDGVLNTVRYTMSLLKHTSVLKDQYGSLFDPTSVDNLKKIIDATDAEIVVSSSWRYKGLESLQEMWKERKLPGVLTGITPYIMPQPDITARRGREIEMYLDQLTQTEKVTRKYVIIDDIDDFLPTQQGNTVITDTERGITQYEVEKAVSILKFGRYIKKYEI